MKVGFGTAIYEPHLPARRRWDTQVALFVGIQWARKGGPTLLEAWRRVAQERRTPSCGSPGPRAEPPANLPPGTRWLGYVSGREALADLYRRASAFVLPSIFDPYPNVLREAMGHSALAVGSDAGGSRDHRAGRDGPRGAVGEPEPLARALVDLLGDPARAERMGPGCPCRPDLVADLGPRGSAHGSLHRTRGGRIASGRAACDRQWQASVPESVYVAPATGTNSHS